MTCVLKPYDGEKNPTFTCFPYVPYDATKCAIVCTCLCYIPTSPVSLSPSSHVQFAKTIAMEYYFEEVQSVKVVVYDVDSELHIGDFSRHDLLGEVEVTLADIISAGQTLTKSLKLPGKSPMHRDLCMLVHPAMTLRGVCVMKRI